jgi:hypothetical protein
VAHRERGSTVDTARIHDHEREECFYCLGSGYVFIGSIDEEGEEIIEAYACRRCSESGAEAKEGN